MKILKSILSNCQLSVVLILTLIIASGFKRFPAPPYTYQPLKYINDGIGVDTIEKGNVDSILLKNAAVEIRNGKYGEVHAMIIFKDNKMLFEEYFPGHQYKWDGPNHHGEKISWDHSMLHGVKSVSKSIVSLCIGIAIDKGFIKSAGQSVFDYLPDHQPLRKGAKKK